MARIRGRAGYTPQTYNKTEVFQWLKTLPLAPEFHPTIEEFQDPIAYIHQIEKQASLYGMCKIIPPVLLPLRKNMILELNKSLLAHSASPESELRPTFTTRVQQVGSCPRKDHPVIKSVRQSGRSYTVAEFEEKAKSFEKNYFKKNSIEKGGLSPLDLETIYWNANADKPIEVEYANDMLGSAFVELDKRRGRDGLTENLNVGDTEWNLKGTARSEGCPLRFIKNDIPGVTSPMLYMGMLFSWFAWHVEDHDLHSLNYLHMGDRKTWYGVSKDAAIAFEEVIRKHGYGGEMNPILSYATIAKKTTVMSPEVILNAGIPMCRLVQQPGEFVVTFPRAYHSGFSHGFNCAEASNIATPEWLKFAREAEIRRAAVNYPPLVSHIQLLYDLALSLSSRVPVSIEPRSSRLKEKKRGEGECLVKELFVQDVMHNTNLLYSLGKGSPAVLLPRDFIAENFPKLRDGNNIPLYSKHINFSSTTTSQNQNIYTQDNGCSDCERSPNTGLFSCVACGVLCFACAAIIKPGEVDVHDNLMSADCGIIGGSGVASEVAANNWRTCSTRDANNAALDSDLGRMAASYSRSPEDTSSLALIALTYEDASDSETELREVSPVSGRDEDYSRSHVFCLQHAFEVEQKLHAHGGVRMLLLCHPDYPKFLAETKPLADELGGVHIWSDISFRTATEEDNERIKSSLDSEGSIYGNSDWAAKLGANLSYANLSRSPLYSATLKRKCINDTETTTRGKSPRVKESAEAADHEQVKVSQNLPKKPEPAVMPGKSSRYITIDLSSASSKATLKRKSMADSEPTSSGRSPVIEESVKALKDKFIIQYKRTYKNKLKVKAIQEETPRPAQNHDQCAEKFDVNIDEKLEGGPSTRLRPRTANHPSKNDPKLVRDKVVAKSALKKHTSSNRAKITSGIQASSVKRAKKSEEADYACKVEGCIMNFGSKQELMLHEKNICSVIGCRKKLASHKYLIQHQKVHIDERPLKCPWKGCTKTFKWEWARTEHMRTHTGARPYTCGETSCGMTFRFVSDFSRHKKKTGHSRKLEQSTKKGKKKAK